MTRGNELNQLGKFFESMDMLTKTTFEVVNQFQSITGDLDSIAQTIERQKNRKEEISVMADLLDEKLQGILNVGNVTSVPQTTQEQSDENDSNE